MSTRVMSVSLLSGAVMMLALCAAQARMEAMPVGRAPGGRAPGGRASVGQAPAGQTSAGQTAAVYRLASAQVVSADGRPPVLKLAASGPVAFELLPADASGEPARPDRIVARLYGVAVGELAGADSLAPFSLAVSGAEGDTIVTIGVSGIAPSSQPSQRLVLRTGARASELEAALVTVP